MGTTAEFLGENVSTVNFSGNVFYLDCKVLLLESADNVFLEIEILEAFCFCCFVPVTACPVVIVYERG